MFTVIFYTRYAGDVQAGLDADCEYFGCAQHGEWDILCIPMYVFIYTREVDIYSSISTQQKKKKEGRVIA